MKQFLRNCFGSGRQRTLDRDAAQKELENWCDSTLGRYLMAAEQASLDTHLATTAGYRAMLMKEMECGVGVEAGPQLHKFTLAPAAGTNVVAVSHMDALPLPSDVLELAVLHHVLDFTDYPHEALKESARVVQASGQLIVVGYNPLSFFGLWRLCGRLFTRRAIWRCRCLSAARTTDWLKLVGFQPERVTYGAYRPPLASGMLSRVGFLDRWCGRWQLPLGNYYVITARKIRVRPIRGQRDWLAKAIKPAKLASRTPISKSSHLDR